MWWKEDTNIVCLPLPRPMTLRTRSAMAILTAAMTFVPALASACGAGMPAPSVGYFSTPLSAKGRFVFVQKISRRLLKEAVAQQRLQNVPVSPEILVRADI